MVNKTFALPLMMRNLAANLAKSINSECQS